MRVFPLVALWLAGCSGPKVVTPAEPPVVAPERLADVASFAYLGNDQARAEALFTEASRVFQHPRCANCHPAGDSPLQGMASVRHEPPVVRGPENAGVAGLECQGCHQDHNAELARVPGAPNWHLAPIEMAWAGKSAAAICAQIKDPARNGGKTLDQIVEHVAHDPLVGWGWAPGNDRMPAPGTQAQAGELLAAWVAAGAACPVEAR